MNKKFWFGYTVFFVFVFPLFFSFAGYYTGSLVMSTFALLSGLLGWVIFIRWAYAKTITHSRNWHQNILPMGYQAPAFTPAGRKNQTSLKFGVIAASFVFFYMVGTFIVHYSLFSNGEGWRFINLWHPWVFTPFWGLFLFSFTERKFAGNKQKEEENL